MRVLCVFVVAAAALAGACQVFAHDGRRMEILVVDDQLFARGYITTGVDDMGGVVRPYYNSMHDHWENSTLGTGASADLPGYDIFAPTELSGYDVTLELLGATKWESPPTDPSPGTMPTLISLDPIDLIAIGNGGGTVLTNSTPDDLILAEDIDVGGAEDLDLAYEIGWKPMDVLYVLEWRLKSNHPTIADSDSVYTVLAPDGDDAVEKMHLAALYLESYLGTPVPEPGSIVLAGAGLGGLLLWSLKRRRRKEVIA